MKTIRKINPIRQPVRGTGEALEVQEIFSTIQGEGPHSGIPAVFIRLGGCNLACNFCDTEFESFSAMPTVDIVTEVVNQSDRIRKLVVITGGEPFRQPIEKLCDMLVKESFTVQIETNGTLYRDVHEKVEIVCSPKNNGNKGYQKIRGDLLVRIGAFKFIISADNDAYSKVAEVGQGEYDIPVFIQPMDEHDEEKNRKNMIKAREIVHKYDYRLSLQLHKIMGIS